MAQETSTTETYTVLVIDDSSAQREMLARVLRRDRYYVLLAEDGEEGLELARTYRPDIIVLDLNLPRLSGIEVCKQLQAHGATATIPAVILSASASPAKRIEAFRVGAVDFVDANCNVDELLVRLDTHRRVASLRRQLQEKNRDLEAEVMRRRHAEAELQERERRLQAIIKVIPDAVFVVDRNYVYQEVFASPAWTPRARVGASIRTINADPPGLADEIEAMLDAALAGETLSTLRYVQEIDGLERHMEAYGYAINDHEVVVIDRDVTEHYRAQEALKENRAHLQAILDALPDPIIRHDRVGRYLEVIMPADFHGIRPSEELVGRSLDEVLPAEIAADIQANVERAIESGALQRYHYALTLSDGVYHREARMMRLNDNEALSIVRDVTEQRRAENALTASEARLHKILRAVPDSIVVLDKEGVYREVYPAVDWTPLAKPGMHLTDLFPDEQLAVFTEAMQRSLREGVVIERERVADVDGERRYLESRAVAIDDNTYVAVIRNVTERKKLEIERERLLHITKQQRDLADKQVAELEALRGDLEQANRLKREFLASMSHELRTPLTAILGFAEVLEMGLGGALNTTQREYVDNIYSAGKHLLGLINDILDLSKIEAGRMDLYAEPVDVADLIENSLAIVRERAQRAGVKLCAEVEGDLSIVADDRKIKQMLYNYLSNAVKFTPSGGTVTVRGQRHDHEIWVEVCDSGTGISASDQLKLFQSFTQLDNEQTRSVEGTGLGLTLVKQLAELHGGRVWVESTLGVGSTFGFALPLAPKMPEATADANRVDTLVIPQEAVAKVPDHSDVRGTIMLVDDTLADLRLLSSILAPQGFDVRPFDNPRKALDAALSNPPDLFLLDVAMPEMNGLELAQTLRRRTETRDIPILFGTILEDDATVLKTFEVGGDDYIGKPFSRAEVIARVTTRLELSKLRRQQGERLEQVETLYEQVHQQARELQKLSSEDSLSGLANRRTLNTRLDAIVRRAATDNRPLSVLMIDIDHFKQVNDRFSHAIGDKVIKQVANILTDNARDTDLVARYGGEEFTVLLPDTPVEAALHVAERMRVSIETFDWATVQPGLTLTVSLGVASIWGRDGDAEPPERLLDLADDKLYKAKQQGRNRVVS